MKEQVKVVIIFSWLRLSLRAKAPHELIVGQISTQSVRNLTTVVGRLRR